jgi:hypothetical protein
VVVAALCDVPVYSGRIYLRSYHVVGAETCSEDERGERKLTVHGKVKWRLIIKGWVGTKQIDLLLLYIYQSRILVSSD